MYFSAQNRSALLPHSAVKDFRINVDQRNGLVRTHFALFELTIEHGLEHITGLRENQPVAFEVLKCVQKLSNLQRKCHI
jgi:hypothetical protein